MQQHRWMKNDGAQRPCGLVVSFLVISDPNGTQENKETSTDRGMFHNSNRHRLGFITSSTHPSSICLGCCHLNCQQPSQARLFPTSPRQKSWLWDTWATRSPPYKHMRPVSDLGCP